MSERLRNRLLLASLTAFCLAGHPARPAAAQGQPPRPGVLGFAPADTVRLTLEEAKQRALANSKLLNMASLNADSKARAVRAAQADYFPKVVGTALYLHFNDDLGDVLSTRRREIRGPLGRTIFTLPGRVFDVAVINQDTEVTNVGVVQPLTDLLKVRQGVKIAEADQQIAQAEIEKGARELASGVEQLYWGLLAARRIQAGAREGVQGAEKLAQTGSLEGRTALVQARQGLQQVDQQVADLEEQLDGLLGLPLCTVLDLVEPPLPVLPYHCADELIGLALAASPEVREAQQDVLKAEAAVAAGKLDYVPSIALVGGYVQQTAADYIQPSIGYVGVVGTYTFVDWGKRRNVIRERQDLVAAASLKVEQTRDEVRQNARKAFREVGETLAALKTAQEMVELRKEAEKKATTPEALRDPTALLAATQARALAEVDAIKAELAYRQAYVKAMALTGKP